MICLAVNTANTVMSIAIVKDGGSVLYRYLTSETRDQGNLLIGHVETGLKTAGLSYEDIDVLAVVTGPGSFTGIRIGISAMRGFALAMGKPLIGISSFDLFSTVQAGRKNLIALESFRDELYLKVNDFPPVNETAQTFAEKLDIGHEYFVTGDAKERMKPFMPEKTLFSDLAPDAVDVAVLAMKKYHDGEGQQERPEPFYLRDADVSVSTKIKPLKVV